MRLTICYSALFLAAMTAQAHAALQPGLYSNVCLERETGDYGGDELELRFRDGKPWARLKICEGGCSTEKTRDVTLIGDNLTMTTIQESTVLDQNGQRQEIETHYWTATREGRAVVVRQVAQPNTPPERLHRQQDYGASDPRNGPDGGGDSMVGWPAPVRRC